MGRSRAGVSRRRSRPARRLGLLVIGPADRVLRRGVGADGGHPGSGGGGTGREAALLLRRWSSARARSSRAAAAGIARLGLGPAQRQCRRPAGVSDLVLNLDHRRLPRRASLAAAVLQWTDSANRPAVPLAVSRRPIIVQSNLRLSGLIRFDLSDSGRFWIFRTGLDLTHNTLMMPAASPGSEPVPVPANRRRPSLQPRPSPLSQITVIES